MLLLEVLLLECLDLLLELFDFGGGFISLDTERVQLLFEGDISALYFVICKGCGADSGRFVGC